LVSNRASCLDASPDSADKVPLVLKLLVRAEGISLASAVGNPQSIQHSGQTGVGLGILLPEVLLQVLPQQLERPPTPVVAQRPRRAADEFAQLLAHLFFTGRGKSGLLPAPVLDDNPSMSSSL
jgi:hypothetical protein